MELTWGRVIVGGFALTTVVAGATWALRADRIGELESRISFYEKSQKLTVPATLKSLEQVNSQILENIEKLTDYQSLKTRNQDLLKSLSQKNIENDALAKITEELIVSKRRDADKSNEQLLFIEADLTEKQKYIENFNAHNEDFVVPEGKSKELFGARLIVGVVDVARHHVTVYYNNQEKEMSEGSFHEIKIDSSSCKLILQHIHWYESPEKASFRITCRKI